MFDRKKRLDNPHDSLRWNAPQDRTPRSGTRYEGQEA